MKLVLVFVIILSLPVIHAWADPHPPTGNNPPITDQDLGGVKAGAIVEYLVLDPPIMTSMGSTVAITTDVLEGIYPEGEANIKPKDGETFKSPGPQNEGDTITWRQVNFLDLGEEGITDNGAWPASGNQFDWKDWGPRDSVNNFTEYAVTWAKWDSGGEVTFFAGADDSIALFVDGEEVLNKPQDVDWAVDQHNVKVNVRAGQWTHIVVKIGESTGECGFTLRTEPVADEVTTVVLTAVESRNRLLTAWGNLKDLY